jgi:hypothetical protein
MGRVHYRLWVLPDGTMPEYAALLMGAGYNVNSLLPYIGESHGALDILADHSTSAFVRKLRRDKQVVDFPHNFE